MKKLLVILVSLMLLCGTAFADAADAVDASDTFLPTQAFAAVLDEAGLTYDLYPHGDDNEDMLSVPVGREESYGNKEFVYFFGEERLTAYVFDVITFDPSAWDQVVAACNEANRNSIMCVYYVSDDYSVNMCTGAFVSSDIGDVCLQLLLEMDESLNDNYSFFAEFAQ